MVESGKALLSVPALNFVDFDHPRATKARSKCPPFGTILYPRSSVNRAVSRFSEAFLGLSSVGFVFTVRQRYSDLGSSSSWLLIGLIGKKGEIFR
jgi:hypothetical protein